PVHPDSRECYVRCRRSSCQAEAAEALHAALQGRVPLAPVPEALRRHAQHQILGLAGDDVGDRARRSLADLRDEVFEARVVVHPGARDEDARRVERDAGRRHRVEIRLDNRVRRRDEHADLRAVTERIGHADLIAPIIQRFIATGVAARSLSRPPMWPRKSYCSPSMAKALNVAYWSRFKALKAAELR